jgi:hypothetical protein
MPRAGLPFAAVGLRAVGFEVDQFETTARDFEGDLAGWGLQARRGFETPGAVGLGKASSLRGESAFASGRPGERATFETDAGAVGFEVDQFEMIPDAVAFEAHFLSRWPVGFQAASC